MTKKEIIKKIVADFPQPIQDLCPELWVEYIYNGKRIRKSLKTGEIIKQEDLSNVWLRQYEFIRDKGEQTMVCSPKKSVVASYCAYHVMEQEVLEIATIIIDAHRGGGPREWTFTDEGWDTIPRIFLFKEDKAVYDKNGEERHPETMKSFNHYFVNYDMHTYVKAHSNVAANIQAGKFFSAYCKYKSNSHLNMVYPWELRESYKRSCKKPRKVSPMDVIANTQLEWPDLSEFPMEEHIVDGRYGWFSSSITNSVIIECKNIEDYLIIRCLKRSWDNRNPDIERAAGMVIPRTEVVSNRREDGRVIISPKGEVGVYDRGYYSGDSEFKRTPKSIGGVLGYTNKGKNLGYIGLENLTSIPKTKYLVPVIEKLSSDKKLTVLVNALRHPVLEQLYKANLDNIANFINGDSMVGAHLLQMFNIKEKKMPLNKLLGMNTYQLKKLEEKFKELESDKNDGYNYRKYDIHRYFVLVAKKLAGVENFASLSKETTDELYSAAEALVNANIWVQDLQRTYGGYWYRKKFNWDIEVTKEERDGLRRICKLCKNDEGKLRVYTDAVRLFNDLPDDLRPQIDIFNIDNLRSLRIIHDDLVQITNVRREEIQRARKEKEHLQTADGFAKRFKATNERYGYTGDKFMIKVPEKPAELTTEGSLLGHCVGGYLRRVATGDTTIVFLRETETPNTPFFTIEISGDEKNKNPGIVQIHGKANAWLGTHPEAIPFVKEWLEEKGIEYNKNILLCTSYGYGSNGHYLDGAEFGL